MPYWDFGHATMVFDRKRRGRLVFELDDNSDTDPADLDSAAGWVAFQPIGNPKQHERLSSRTDFRHAKAVIGSLRGGAYDGMDVPVGYKGPAATLDGVLAMLSAAELAP